MELWLVDQRRPLLAQSEQRRGRVNPRHASATLTPTRPRRHRRQNAKPHRRVMEQLPPKFHGRFQTIQQCDPRRPTSLSHGRHTTGVDAATGYQMVSGNGRGWSRIQGPSGAAPPPQVGSHGGSGCPAASTGALYPASSPTVDRYHGLPSWVWGHWEAKPAT
jgi:hypothetical protein